jgi:hypothetical protein
MNKYEMVATLTAMTMAGGVVMTLITSWFRYREKSLSAGTRSGSTLQEERLARIEGAVEAIAIEVERISEGQRFTTRLLTERQALAATTAAGELQQYREERHHAS